MAEVKGVTPVDQVPVAADTIDQQAQTTPQQPDISQKDAPVPAPEELVPPHPPAVGQQNYTGNGYPQPSDFPPEADPRMEALTRPSDFPNEPVTSGFGLAGGVDFIRQRFETNDQFFNRVANELQTSPEVSRDPDLEPYVARLRRGT